MNTFLPTLILLASEKSSLRVKKTLISASSDADIQELHSICVDILFGRIAIDEGSRKRLERVKERIYPIAAPATNATIVRGRLKTAGSIRILSLLLTAALPTLLSPDEGPNIESSEATRNPEEE